MSASRRQRATDDGPQARDRLLEAGTALFSERGYAAASVGAICERAGVGKPALYWHFESKEGLLAAVLDSLSSRWIEDVGKQAAAAADPGTRLHGMMQGMRRLVVEEPHLLRLPTLASLEQGKDSESIRAAVVRLWEDSHEALVAGTAQATGLPRADLEGFAFAALGLLSAAAFRYSIDGDVERLDRNFTAMEQALRALLAIPLEENE